MYLAEPESGEMEDLTRQLCVAAGEGDDEAVTSLLARGAEVDAVVAGRTALRSAAGGGQWWGLVDLYTDGLMTSRNCIVRCCLMFVIYY